MLSDHYPAPTMTLRSTAFASSTTSTFVSYYQNFKAWLSWSCTSIHLPAIFFKLNEMVKKMLVSIGYLQSCWVVSESLWSRWRYSTVVFRGRREHFLDAANKILSFLAMRDRVPWVGLWKCSQVQCINKKYVRKCPHNRSTKATYFYNYLDIKGGRQISHYLWRPQVIIFATGNDVDMSLQQNLYWKTWYRQILNVE